MSHLVRRAILASLAVALVLGVSAPARAQSIKILNLECKQPGAGTKPPATDKDAGKNKKKKKKKKTGKRPYFVAEIMSDAGEAKAKDFKLEQVDLDEPISIVGERVVPYKDIDDPVYMVVLVQADAFWMGDDMIEDVDEKLKHRGAFRGLPAALNELIQDAPQNAKASLITYGGGKATVRYPMGPVKDMPASLGTQKDYRNNSSVPLVPGLASAISELNKPGRRILVIFGDGNAQAADVDKQLVVQKDDLRKKKIETYAIHFAVGREDVEVPKARLWSLATESRNRFTAESPDNFSSLAKQIKTRIANRLYVHFPSVGFKLDGKPHDMQITYKDEAPEDIRVNFLRYEEKKGGSGGSLWWLWLLLILFLFLIIVILIVKRKPAEPEYIEEEYYDDEPEPEAAPAQKTMMIGMGGRDDGTPVVGWIVPLNGNNRFQTYKLLAGATVIGSDDSEAHVIIADQFVSSVHAQIVTGPQGFILLDKGSANGCYVMDKRVTEHELVDNDVFTLGKTDFKFKTIN